MANSVLKRSEKENKKMFLALKIIQAITSSICRTNHRAAVLRFFFFFSLLPGALASMRLRQPALFGAPLRYEAGSSLTSSWGTCPFLLSPLPNVPTRSSLAQRPF